VRGDTTLAACLITSDNLARTAVLDIDVGSEDSLLRVLAAVQVQGFTGFAQTARNDEHNGGHVWLLFDGFAEPIRLRTLAENPLSGTVPETLRRLYATAAHASANGDTARVAQVISVINAGRAGDEALGRALLAEQEIVHAA